MKILGTALHEIDKKHVLAAYVHRSTKEHVPLWAYARQPNGKPYPQQFASDLDWLAHTFFEVRRDGRLDRRVKACVSHPTWPDGVPA